MNLNNIPFKQSINYTKGSKKKEYIVIHCMEGSFEGSISWFSNPKSRVSANYLISQAGEVLCMVKTTDTAWANRGINNKSISIEHEDKRNCLKNGNWITKELWETSINLSAALCKKFNIDPMTHIIGHNDPLLKKLGNDHQCPGPYFDLEKYKKDVKERLTNETI